MFFKSIVGTFNDGWRYSVKPALMDGLRSPILEPAALVTMVWAMNAERSRLEKDLALRHPAPQPQTQEAAVAAPQAKPVAKKKTSRMAVERGRICVQIKDEMKRIGYMTLEGGKKIADIRTERPDFSFWQFVESRELPEEDRETALHPNQWGAGYKTLLLSKYFGVSKVTIRDYITAYNRTVRNKTPRAH